MFDIEIIRTRLATTACTGVLRIRSRSTRKILFECVTLEEDIESCEAGQDHRIPEGDYHCVWHENSRFTPKITAIMGYKQPPLQLWNDIVPKSRYILIHAGNTHLDTEGCILLGLSVDAYGESISKSRDAIREFYRVFKDVPAENIRVRIENHLN